MKKAFVLIGVIVSGLIALSLYSTYAMYVSVSNDINMSTSLSYEFNIDNQSTFKIPANKVLHFNAIIKNPYDDTLKYGIYHTYTSSNSNVIIGEVVSDKSSVTVAPSTSGSIDANKTMTIPIAVINKTSSEISVSFGVIYGYANNDITYGSNQKLITSTVNNEDVYNESCVNNYQFDESACTVKLENGNLNKYCSAVISSEVEILQTQYRYGEEACAAYKCCTTTKVSDGNYDWCTTHNWSGYDCKNVGSDGCTDGMGDSGSFLCADLVSKTTCTENQTSCASGATATCTSTYINYFDWSTTDRTGQANCQKRICARDFKGIYSLCDDASDC